MPVDPVTGEEIPYAGEPGAAPGAPPRPSAGAGAAPMPPAGAADQAMQGMEDEQTARMQAVAASAPQPTEAYDVKLIAKLVDELNDLADKALGGDAVPDIEFDAGGESKLAEPLPGNVFVPLVAVNEMARQLGFDKYTFEPTELNSNAGLRKAAAMVRQMAQDEDFIAAVTEPQQADADMEQPEETMAPGEFSDEDRELMDAMPEDDLMTA